MQFVIQEKNICKDDKLTFQDKSKTQHSTRKKLQSFKQVNDKLLN